MQGWSPAAGLGTCPLQSQDSALSLLFILDTVDSPLPLLLTFLIASSANAVFQHAPSILPFPSSVSILSPVSWAEEARVGTGHRDAWLALLVHPSPFQTAFLTTLPKQLAVPPVTRALCLLSQLCPVCLTMPDTSRELTAVWMKKWGGGSG